MVVLGLNNLYFKLFYESMINISESKSMSKNGALKTDAIADQRLISNCKLN